MRTLVIDFETFFDQHFSLKKLPALAYVRSPKFKVHGAAVKIDDQPTEWVTGAELPRFFRDFNWPDVRVVMHNSNFDNLVLVEQYGYIAGELVDTLGLCRALLPSDMDFNLDALGKLFDVGGKTGGGEALVKAKGLYTLPQALEDELAEYAIQDVDITKIVFDQLYPAMPPNECRALDLVTRLSTVGLIKGDPEGFDHTRQEILDDRYTKLEAAGVDDPATLRSRDKFAELLKAKGIDPPTKISATTGERTWAFSKQDVEFVRLKADEQAGPLVEAKLAWTSNTAISRCERLAEISKRAPHTLPMQLNFSGAHTHRLSGGGGVNMQNLPARGLGSSIREAFVAPPGHVICVADLSGIELRMNMWFCGEWPMINLIRNGGDIYIVEAARQFKKPEGEIVKRERQYGKVVQLGCGYGMGADKFRKLAGTGPMGMPPMYLTEDEARNTITNYRQGVPQVTAMWRWLNDVALQVLAYKDMQPVDCGPVQITHNRIRLPNGLDLHYPNVEITEDGASWGVNGKQHYIYGGIMLENIIQALAGTLVKQQMVEIDRRLDGPNFTRNGNGKGAVVHQVHDEILTICREEDADEVLSTMYEVMRIQPDWAPNLPLDVEGGWGTYYIDK